VNSLLLLVLVGLFYILIVGGISLLRREGLSGQFALEALAIIALAILIGAAIGTTVDPVLLFILLYLVTMRARLLTDLANLLFKRRGYAAAEKLYRLALRLHPDRTSRFVALTNWGAARSQSGDIEGAIRTLNDVLVVAEEHGGLGSKLEAACRYNLAVAYGKAGDDVKAVQQFNQVIERFPVTVYGQAAERALKKRRERGLPKQDSD
jgi:tetratricopeptide (TPR) repeat protein